MSYTDRVQNLRRPQGDLVWDGNALRGHVFTPHGIVRVYGEAWSERWCSLALCHGGRFHRRRYDHLYSERYIVTLAARFAREIAEAAP